MKILFFTGPREDYLADSIFHGLRTLYGKDCVDYPKCEMLYKNCPPLISKQVRGHGFTLYSGLLEDIEIDRYDIDHKIKVNYFDLIILSSIWNQYGYFIQYRPWLSGKNTIILDGADTDQPYPAAGLWWRKLYYWGLPVAHKEFLYFKREWTPNTHFRLWMHFLPVRIRKLLQPKNLRCISFSIPQEKIIAQLPIKKKDFPKHIVDKEVALGVEGSTTSYAFDNEFEYYQDLQLSKYGITTKKAGWDCLRHYEIAANGAVLCFKNLYSKPSACAPHGLDETNTIVYNSLSELKEKLEKLSASDYLTYQHNILDWVKNHTTIKIAEKVINEFNAFNSNR
jgi:hypothetical protein